jgi:hypothetical protein
VEPPLLLLLRLLIRIRAAASPGGRVLERLQTNYSKME